MYVFGNFFQKGHCKDSSKKRAHWQKTLRGGGGGGGGGADEPPCPPALESLKDGLCYLRNESVTIKVFLPNMHEATDFIRSGQASRHLNYYAY